MTKSYDELWNEFVSPPDSARPRAWWHWMDGNVDLEGIRADLKWLHAVGVRGVQVFDGALGTPLVVEEGVVPGTSRWREAIDTAVTTAHELGLDFTVATSAGWSAAGAPWVSKADAMRKLVWSETTVEGGTRVQLAELPDVIGTFQDVPRWGNFAVDGGGDAQDLFAVAIPFNTVHDELEPCSYSTSDAPNARMPSTRSVFGGGIRLNRDPDNESTAWVALDFSAPVTVRSCVIELPGPQGYGAAPAALARLQVRDVAGNYVDVTTFPATQCVSRTMSFPAVSGTHFRLELLAQGMSTVLAAFEKGVNPPPVFQPLNKFIITRFALYEAGLVAHREAKSGFATAMNYDVLENDPRADSSAVPLASVIDVSAGLSDGFLTTPLPDGQWRVVRFGSSITGQTNGPALAAATGLEVDKLDADRVREYISRHLAQFGDVAIDGLLSDSIEAGLQNITDKLHTRFNQLRGYDMVPWMLCAAGFMVENSASSDLFLSDFRRTIAEVFSTDYYGVLADEAHKRGALYYAEALEDRRPQLGDDLAMRSHADVPMGAMWTFNSETGPAPTYVADLKGAASVAHVYGRQHTGSEAFTSGRNPWSDSPKSLKHIADLQLTLGVTRFCIHSSPHQPTQVPAPGIALAPTLGQAFTRNETWAECGRPWIDYLARCSHLLSRGRPAVDIAYFTGEEGPVTALFGSSYNEDVPVDYDYDFIGPDALKNILSTTNGQLNAGTSRYRLLYLGGSSSRMSTGALQAVLGLVKSGATLVGARPRGTRSLSDDDRLHKHLCDRIWGGTLNGKVFPTTDLSAVLHNNFPPRIVISDSRIRRVARWWNERPLIFVSNPLDIEIRTSIALSDSAEGLVGWDPVTLSQHALKPSDDTEEFEVVLAPYGSLFILPGDAPRAGDEQRRNIDGLWSLAMPGSETLTLPDAVFWTELGADGLRFSGTATYRFEFDLAVDEIVPHAIEFTDIADIAEIRINGKQAGTVWTAPYRLSTGALRVGRNQIEICVTNPWRNRLIAEAASKSGELFPPMTSVFTLEAEIKPAGLLGPVIFLSERSGTCL